MKARSLARWLARLGVVALLVPGSASAAEVHVMISAGFYQVYAELGPAFERASGHRLITTRGPSMGDSPEAIPTRLERGETADVVILDGAAADELAKRGSCAPAVRLISPGRRSAWWCAPGSRSQTSAVLRRSGGCCWQ